MRFVIGSFIVIALVVALASRRSWSDAPPPPPPDTSATDTGLPALNPVMPKPGDESVLKDPFAMYDTGPGPLWSYDQLTPEEKAVADLGNDIVNPVDWQAVHDSYASAVALQLPKIAALNAANRLNLGDLSQGVVP